MKMMILVRKFSLIYIMFMLHVSLYAQTIDPIEKEFGYAIN